MTSTVLEHPQVPFLMMNRHYIWLHDGSPKIPFTMLIRESSFERKRFAIDAIVIDSSCKQFEVCSVINLGFWWPSLLWPIYKEKFIKTQFNFGPSIQMTFEEAKSYIVDHVVDHRWAGQTGATPTQWREMRMKHTSMDELMRNISFYGKYVY